MNRVAPVSDKLRPEYHREDFGPMECGKYTTQGKESSNIVLLDPDNGGSHLENERGHLMASAPRLDALIEESSELRGGRPVIAGTETTIHLIVDMKNLGLDAEDIAIRLPYLDLAQIYAALAYYHLHIDEIDADSESIANAQQT